MNVFRSRIAVSLAALAATTMAASPALAHGYDNWGRHRHRDGIDGGAVIAGILAIGGIAALVSASNSAKKAREEQAQPDPDYYQQQPQQYQQAPLQGGYDGYEAGPRPAYPGGLVPGEQGYGAPQDGEGAPYADEQGYAGSNYGTRSFDAAVDRCSDEIERGDRRIADVESVRRMGERTAVEGRLEDGRGFACSVDAEGRIRSVAVDGHAMI